MHWIEIYKFDKRLNSTKRPVDAQRTGTYDVVLKRPCSVINPVFLLRTSEKIETLSRNNYLYWKSEDTDFRNIKNFYWIDNVTYTANNQIEITCHRDPFATFRNAIHAYNGLVARSSTGYDTTIYDNELLVSSKVRKKATHTATVVQGTGSTSVFNHVSCTMSTIGKDGMTVFNFSYSTIETVVNYLLSGSGQWEFGVTSPGQYINSCILLPFVLADEEDYDPIPIGNLSANIHTQYHKINTVTAIDNVTFSFKFERLLWTPDLLTDTDDFRNYTDRFTKVKIWAPFVGNIDVPAIHLKASRLKGTYVISPENGQGRFRLEAQYDQDAYTHTDVIITTVCVNMAMDVPVAMGRTDYKQIANDVIDVASAVGSMAIAGVATYASGGVAAGGLLSSGESAAKTGVNVAADFAGGFQEYTVLGSAGSLAEMDDDFKDAKITIQQMETVTEDIYHEKGRPKMSYEAIGTSERFINMYAPSIDIPGATASEINTINATLASGIYIE